MNNVEWTIVPLHSKEYYSKKLQALRDREKKRKGTPSSIDSAAFKEAEKELSKLIAE